MLSLCQVECLQRMIKGIRLLPTSTHPCASLGTCLRLMIASIHGSKNGRWERQRQELPQISAGQTGLRTNPHETHPSDISQIINSCHELLQKFKPAVYTTISFVCNHRAFWKKIPWQALDILHKRTFPFCETAFKWINITVKGKESPAALVQNVSGNGRIFFNL